LLDHRPGSTDKERKFVPCPFFRILSDLWLVGASSVLRRLFLSLAVFVPCRRGPVINIQYRCPDISMQYQSKSALILMISVPV